MRLTTAVTKIELLYQNDKQWKCYRLHLENGRSIDVYNKYWRVTRLVTETKKKKKGGYVILLNYVPFDLSNNAEWIYITQETVLDNKSKNLFSNFVRV